MLNNDIPISHTDDIPPGIPAWRSPNFTLTVPQTNETIPFSEIAYTIGPGIFFIAFVGMFETISVGKAFGKKGNYKIDYNQELLAVGLSNILCSFVSGHPVTGAFLRSAINFSSGVKTPAAGMLAAAVVLVCLTVATPLMTYIPVCAMAATIMMGGIDVVTFHKFGIVWSTKRADIVPYLVTFIVSLTWGIQYGVFIGVGVDLLMLLYSSMTPGIKIIPASNDASVKVIAIQPKCGFLFPAVERMMVDISNGEYAGVQTLLLDVSQVFDVDTTVVQGLRVIREQYKKKDIRVFIYNPQPAVEVILNRTTLKEFILKPSSSAQLSS